MRSLVEPVLVAHGLDVVDVEWTGGPSGAVLRVTIERPGASDAPDPTVSVGAGGLDAGVSLEDCADVSRDLSTVLDVEDVIPQHYNLEVSSPGLERRLRHLADCRRFAGRLASVKLSRPAPDGQRALRGRLLETADDRVALEVDGKRIEFPFTDVRDAHLVFELTTQPKRTPAKRATKKKAERNEKGRVQR